MIWMAKKPMARLMAPQMMPRTAGVANGFAGANDEQSLVLGGIKNGLV